MNPIQVMIVDDHSLVREGLRALLARSDRVRVCAEASDGDEALSRLAVTDVDVLLLDWMMPRMDGLSTCREVSSKYPSVRVLMLTNHLEDSSVRDAIQVGATGYLLKDVSFDELESAILDAATGTTILHPEARESLETSAARAESSPLGLLTERETDVLRLIVRGQSNKEIGNSLSLTEGTVKGYVSTILAKTNTADRTQAALLAVRLGLS